MRFGFKGLVLPFVVGGLVFFAGYKTGSSGFGLNFSKGGSLFPKVVISRETPARYKDVNFGLFWTVWDRVSALYVDPKLIDPSKMVYGAIGGMVSSLGDPYTVFLPPKENKSSKEDLGGSFEGVGIQLGFDAQDRLSVTAPLDGSPAAKAGVKPGDLILNIKDKKENVDKETYGLSLPEAVELIRGRKGTVVELKMFRVGQKEPFDVALTRDTIVIKSVELSFADKGTSKVAVLKLNKFGGNTDKEWEDAVSRIKAEEKISGSLMPIVLDLRNNPGGYLDGAVWTASEFLKSGVVVSQKGRDGKGDKVYEVDRMGNLLTEPLVVILNGGSASAAEILAGALRDNNRAKLVGEKSFGKGTVQQPEDLAFGAGLHVTIAKWFLPGGSSIDKVGVTPEFLVKNDEDVKVDEQLQKALEIL